MSNVEFCQFELAGNQLGKEQVTGGAEDEISGLEEAGNRGIAVHQGIKELLKGCPLKYIDFSEEVWKHLQTWVNWREDCRPETTAIEQSISLPLDDSSEGEGGSQNSKA